MYIVFHEGVILYVGRDAATAADLSARNFGASIRSAENIEQLAEEFDHHLQDMRATDVGQQTAEVRNSASFKALVEYLDRQCGINDEFAQRVRESGQKAVAEVRSLGIQGMKTVGEGFIALGDLLRKASEPEQPKT